MECDHEISVVRRMLARINSYFKVGDAGENVAQFTI